MRHCFVLSEKLESRKDRLVVTYGNVIAATINRSRDGSGNFHAETATLLWVHIPVPQSKKRAYRTGALPSLNLDRWSSLLRQLNDEPDFSPDLTGVHVHIGTLIPRKTFPGLTLTRATKMACGVQLWLAPRSTGMSIGIRLLMEKCLQDCIGSIPVRSPSRPGVEGQKRQQSKTLPALDVVADTFLIGDKQLGRLELVAGQDEQTWRVEKLNVTSPDSSIMVRGLWQSRSGPPGVHADSYRKPTISEHS